MRGHIIVGVWCCALGFVYGLMIGSCACVYADAGHERYKIAVIDTGYDPARAPIQAKLCQTGHYDFFTKTANINFTHVHGTEVASIIADKLKDIDYCLIIVQLYESPPYTKQVKEVNIVQALNDTIGLGVVAVNLSWGGVDGFPAEREALAGLAKAKITVFAAAGNEKQNLDENCNFYPACYKLKNMIVVGARDFDHPTQRAADSNYGKLVDVWAPGYYRMDGNDLRKIATSYATPRALAEYVLFLEHKRLAALKHK